MDKFKKYPKNGILLTAREHFFCHKLLIKIFPTGKMIHALWYMSNYLLLKSSREYQNIRNLYLKYQKEHPEQFNNKGWNNSKNQLEKIKTLLKNYGVTNPSQIQENRQKSKERMKLNNPNKDGHQRRGIKHTKESKIKMSNSKKGKIPGNKGKKGLQIGVWKGKSLPESMKKQISKKMKGKHLYNNGIKNIYADECPEGFVSGRKNNTKFRQSEESNKKRSESLIGNVFWNNGIENKRAKECPGPNFIRGKLKVNLNK